MRRARLQRILVGLTFAFTVRATGANADSPTWVQHVAPILAQHCIECHRPAGVAPFSLLTHTDAAKRAKFIAEIVADEVMPPWLPRNAHGQFEGERRLSPAEKNTLAAWASAGAPAGEKDPPPLTPPVDTTLGGTGWVLGPPDVIVKMPRTFSVPAGSDDVYRAFVIPLAREAIPADVGERARIPDTDMLGVAAVEIHPGNRRVLHHAHVWVDTSGDARRLEAAATDGAGYSAFGNPGFAPSGYLGGYVPGTTPRRFRPGLAETYVLGGDLVLQAHYSPTGKPESDLTEVGIYFTREPVKRTIEWLRLGSFNIEIPAGAAEHVITDELEIPADTLLVSISPHMHFVGRAASAAAVLPDGTTIDLLQIPRWDFAWQDRYTYAEPLYLPKGTRVRARWIFDNSAANPRNPHSPPRPVHFGPNTTDEMCELHLFVVPRHLDDYAVYAPLMRRKMAEKIAELSPSQRLKYGFERLPAAK
jgi:mono/diheme cytochrome c family protein